jgi:putative ABC transport system permease protein
MRSWMDATWKDLVFALRALLRSPSFAATALLTIALGIGASTAISTIFEQVFVRALPVVRPGELVQLRYTGVFKGHSHTFGGDDHQYFSYPMYRDLRDRAAAFDGAVLGDDKLHVGALWHGASALDAVELVTGNYFSVLGVRPTVGRVLLPADEGAPGTHPVAVLSYNTWRRSFGGSPAVVGQTLLINGQPFQIVGVAQQGFRSVISDSEPDLFVPITMRSKLRADDADAKIFEDRRSEWMPVYARLLPGESREAAQTALQPLWHALRADELSLRGRSTAQFTAEFLTHSSLLLDSAKTGFSPARDRMRAVMAVLLTMVALLLAMTVANLAGLMLVRGARRQAELLLRAALGASRARIVRQLTTEGLLLGVGGAVLGAALAPALARVLVQRLLGAGAEEVFSPVPDAMVLGCTSALAVAASLGFSLVPALAATTRRRIAPGGLHRGTAGSAHDTAWLRRGAVLLQVALSVVLLCGAGLFVRTLHNLKAQSFGLSPEHVLAFDLDPTLAGYTAQKGAALHTRVSERLRALPGVEAVGGTTDPDLVNDDDTGNLTVEGHRLAPDEEIEAEQPTVLPGYFAALRIPLLAGRAFTDADRGSTEKIAIVNELFAKTYFGSAAGALGHMFAHGAGDQTFPDTRIVGVVANAKHKLRDRVSLTEYEPFRGAGRVTYYLRTTEAPEAAEASVSAAVREVDPRLVADHLDTMAERMDSHLNTETALALLGAAFGGAALLITGVGLYGVLAYATAQRTREIGIRMALGALRGSVVRLVVGDMVALAAIALALALAASGLLARLVASELYQVSPLDPAVLAACAGLTALMVAVAAFVPAWRAANVDPNQALRAE